MTGAFNKVFSRLLDSAAMLHETQMGKERRLQPAALIRNNGFDLRAYEHLHLGKAHGDRHVDV